VSALRRGLVLAHFVLLEARRSGLPWIVLAACFVAIGLAGFVSRLALTESAQLQASVVATLFRTAAVFVLAAFVVTAVVREANEKGIQLLLSLPISRSAYYLGKLTGFAITGALLSAAFSIVLLWWCSPTAVFAWFVSLAVESALIAAVSLFFVSSLGQVVPALAAVGGVYLLGRAISAIQSIAASPLAPESGAAQQMAIWAIDAIALLLPPLNRVTETEWLLYAPPTVLEFMQLMGALALYGLLITAAGLFDFHRRNL
jgi:ABC-type transport system involved in multi-copper enzyme maturation permease subunit